MLAGLALIGAGIGLLLTADACLGVTDSVNKSLARRSRQEPVPRVVTWFHDFNARWGALSVLWFGRAVAVAAIGVGLVLMFRA